MTSATREEPLWHRLKLLDALAFRGLRLVLRKEQRILAFLVLNYTSRFVKPLLGDNVPVGVRVPPQHFRC